MILECGKWSIDVVICFIYVFIGEMFRRGMDFVQGRF